MGHDEWLRQAEEGVRHRAQALQLEVQQLKADCDRKDAAYKELVGECERLMAENKDLRTRLTTLLVTS